MRRHQKTFFGWFFACFVYACIAGVRHYWQRHSEWEEVSSESMRQENELLRSQLQEAIDAKLDAVDKLHAARTSKVAKVQLVSGAPVVEPSRAPSPLTDDDITAKFPRLAGLPVPMGFHLAGGSRPAALRSNAKARGSPKRIWQPVLHDGVEVRLHYESFKGQHLVVREAGAIGAAVSVLLLHDSEAKTAGSFWDEAGTLAALAKCGLRGVAIDRPGYGNSDALEGAAAAEDGGAYVAGLAAFLRLQRPVLVAAGDSFDKYATPRLLSAGGQVQLSGVVAVGVAEVGLGLAAAAPARRPRAPPPFPALVLQAEGAGGVGGVGGASALFSPSPPGGGSAGARIAAVLGAASLTPDVHASGANAQISRELCAFAKSVLAQGTV
jgi:hypothetical protein